MTGIASTVVEEYFEDDLDEVCNDVGVQLETSPNQKCTDS